MNCPLCHNTGSITRPDTFVPSLTISEPCPNGCADRLLTEHLRRRIAAGATTDDILGLQPAGMSLVEPHQRNRRTVLKGELA